MSITVAREDGVLRLTLARPEKKNALDLVTLDALAAALAEARDDATVRVVLLDAQGSVFCAGGDIEVMRTFAGDAQATLARLRGGLNRVVQLLHDLPKPVVCAVQGNAYGAGAVLAFQCDLTVVAKEAAFAMSFRHVGLIPDTGGTWLLPRVVGLQRAKHLVWTGAPFTGEQAVAWGLALETVESSRVGAHAIRLAKALVDGPAAATGLAKQAMHRNLASGLANGLEREAYTQGRAFLTPEHAEGRDAFFARRRPAWNKDN